ncbi:MAG: pseudouridine synthase [Bacteroidota bacterium]|nr:pseudouridine synthase [Bacteroidota bacterium]
MRDNPRPERENRRERSGEHRERSGEHKERSGEHKERSGDRKYRSGEHKERSGEHKYRSGEHKEHSGERKERSGDRKYRSGEHKEYSGEHKYRSQRNTKPERPQNTEKQEGAMIRLNRYISNAGICSRREADKLIQAGAIKVNGVVITELGTKISRSDKVQYGEETLSKEAFRYLLLNKPKGFITTIDDPQERKTVMSLVSGACTERIYPVGRLDRNTTGLLLFTNDGEMAKKLSHPRYAIKKVYHVVLDQGLTRSHLDQITKGLELEDGFVKVDAIEYVGEGNNKKEVGVELHSGKNRIVRRIFEQLGYKVVRLDRVFYAGLTKKNLPRGHWRFLEEHEINMLKMIS